MYIPLYHTVPGYSKLYPPGRVQNSVPRHIPGYGTSKVEGLAELNGPARLPSRRSGWSAHVLTSSGISVNKAADRSSERARGDSTPGGPPCLSPDRLCTHDEGRGDENSNDFKLRKSACRQGVFWQDQPRKGEVFGAYKHFSILESCRSEIGALRTPGRLLLKFFFISSDSAGSQ